MRMKALLLLLAFLAVHQALSNIILDDENGTITEPETTTGALGAVTDVPTTGAMGAVTDVPTTGAMGAVTDVPTTGAMGAVTDVPTTGAMGAVTDVPTTGAMGAVTDVPTTGAMGAVTDVPTTGAMGAVTDVPTTGAMGAVTDTTPGYTLTCTFETDLCGWTQSTKDEFDWRRNQGATRTLQTGPLGDHTTKNGNGWYMYIESTSTANGDTASLDYQFPSTVSAGCFSMYYHMYGSSIGSLSVESLSTNGNRELLWSQKGNQGDQWQKMLLPIVKPTDKISITAQTIYGVRGDIAIDDISYTTAACPQAPINCTFNEGLCGWKQASYPTDSLDWRALKGKTPSPDTGPQWGHGSYLYIEATSTTKGEKATLTYTLDKPIDKGCLSLYYNMNGMDVGTLRIESTSVNSSVKQLWSLSGYQGVKWYQLFANITENTQTLSITGETTGLGYLGDIAIDNVTLSPSECQAETINCHFDADYCGWKQESKDDFNWILHKGQTPSAGTGPLGTRTGRGNYLYIEASSKKVGSTAMITYRFNQPVGEGCLYLNYHMYGANIGSLSISGKRDGTTPPTVLWSLSGNQGDKWQKVYLPIKQQVQEVQITGEVGPDFTSDIAIDDIKYTSNICPQGASTFELCPKEMAFTADPSTGSAVITLSSDGVKHRLSLPVGKYPYTFTNEGVKCSVIVTVYDSRVVQRLEFEAVYPRDCSVLSNLVTKEMVMSSANSKRDLVKKLCAGDCTVNDNASPRLSCVHNKLVIHWPTETTFTANATFVPEELNGKLTKRLLDADKDAFKIVISTSIPPIVYPTPNQDGSSARAVLQPLCTAGTKFNQARASCE